MVTRIRNKSWADDQSLEEPLGNYNRQGYQRKEILSFMVRGFGEYAWSLRSLDRRLSYFNIHHNDRSVSVEDVKPAINKELMGPGRLLGYHAMHLKIKNVHGLNVPRDLVYAAMTDLDSDGLKMRQPGNKKPKEKGTFVSAGPNWVMSLDGHDKLMGFQNNTFLIAIYGAIDTASRKLLWIKVWVTNRIPELVAQWHFEFLYETRVMPNYIRIDKGSETGTFATMYCFLRRQHSNVETDEEAVKTVIYGPSTLNQIVLLNVVDMYAWN